MTARYCKNILLSRSCPCVILHIDLAVS